MSEYQYYEFAAIDRALTRDEMAELRSRSTRAKISPTSFIHDYRCGDLKGKPTDWMRRCFDAFIHTASWRSCRLALRFPRDSFDERELRQFATERALTVAGSDTHWIVDWSLEDGQDHDRFATDDGRGWMTRLSPLRDELLCGDSRPLYLGWLAGVCAGEVADDVIEPQAPPGMSELSVAQQALVEFLEIDPALLAAAATGSLPDPVLNDDDSIEVWQAGLRRGELSTIVSLLLGGSAQQAQRYARSAFLAWKKESGSEAAPARRRKVADLKLAAENLRQIDDAAPKGRRRGSVMGI